MFVAKAIIDHSDGVEEYFDEVVDLVEELVISAECDVIVLDNSFGYEMTEEYKRIKKMADEYNVSIFHYEDMALYMSEENEHFDYDSVPFEVFELKLEDEDLFAAGILEACHSFEEKVKDFPLCERNDTVIHPTLQLAVRDCILRMNPSDNVMMEIKKSKEWIKEKRHALTIEQQKAFMTYAKNNVEFRGWLPILTVFLGTGCRIGEVLGLTWDDLDFEKRLISINHNAVYHVIEDEEGNRHSEMHINTPKTEAGNRIIPMIDEVYEAFLEEYEIQSCLVSKIQVVDGFTNFIFTTANGTIFLPQEINRAIKNICDAYNKEEIQLAKGEYREPVLLPHFTAHHLRHTFCTRFCENETNLKVIQEIMGHSDISTTMDIYAEATDEKKKEILTDLQGKIMVM